mmetsp:Transcript_11545/g.20302  ORF Transcript_11545/g.20302 Transcript_11545/m.20302 type:complete len:154 (-) Transcript_11545:79-540(-)
MAAPNPALVDIKGDVAHRLEANGALDQIRVQIRASVYQALLSSKGSVHGQSECLRNAPVNLVSVVADFLQRVDLDKTREVFLRESTQPPLNREELAKGFAGCVEIGNTDRAVLEEVVAEAKRKSRTGTGGSDRNGVPATIPEEEMPASDRRAN